MLVTDAQVEIALNTYEAAIRYGNRMDNAMRFALEAASSAQAPDGWQLVPIEPTQRQFETALHDTEVSRPGALREPKQTFREFWCAMLRNAPSR